MLFIKRFFFSTYSSIYLSLIIPIIFIFHFFKKIRFGYIRTKGIGDYATPMEIFNCECKGGIHDLSDTILVWYKDFDVPNNFIFKKLFKDYIVMHKYLIRPIFNFFNRNDYLKKKFIIPFRYVDKNYFKEKDKIVNLKNLSLNMIWQSRDIYNVLEKFPPQIKLTDREVSKCLEYLKSKNIKDKVSFICFSSRVSDFRLSETRSGQASLRNGNIHNQIKAINYWTNKKNNYAFRMGRGDKKDPLKNISNKIFDYKFDIENSDILDAFLFSNCKFSISGGNGINNFPTIFRKPKLVIDFVNFRDLNTENPHKFPLMLPKLYLNKESNKLITFSECIKKGIFQMNTVSQLNEAGYQLLDNSEDEILEVVKEMEALTNGGKKSDNSNQDYFWDMITDNYIYTSKNFRIGYDFFKKYEGLFR